MKKHFLALCALVAVAFVAVVSCNKVEPYDDTELKEQISALDQRLQAVEALNQTVADLQAKVDGIYTLQFKVTDANEIQYSLDGGKTWVDTGVVLPVMPEIPEIPEPEECLVASVEDNGDYITFTLSDGSTFDVEKVEVVKFEIVSGKQFFASLETKEIPVVAKGLETAMVAKTPKGWSATYAKGALTVTAPNEEDAEYEEIGWDYVCVNMEFSGSVELWAVGDDNKVYVGSVGVGLGEAATTIAVGDDNNTVTFSFANKSWETTATYYGAAFKEDFDPQTIVDKVLANDLDGILSNEDPETYDFVYEVETTIEALAGRVPVAGEEVIVWALETVYDSNYELAMTKDDFIRVYVAPVDVEFSATPSFCDAALDIKVIGANSFFGLALNADYYDPEYFNIQEYIAPMWGMGAGYTYNTDTYVGNYSEFGQDPIYEMVNTVSQNTKYYVVIVPLKAGKDKTEYTNDDCFFFDFTSSAIVEGGSSTVTFGEPEIGFDNIEVTATTTGLITFHTALTEDDIFENGLDTDAAIIEYLLDPANYYVNITKEAEFEAYQSGNPGEEITFVAIPVDADGKHGTLAKLETAFKEISYSQTITLAIDEDNTVVGVDYIDLKLNITGTPSRYVVYTPYWATETPEEYELNMIGAEEGSYGYSFYAAEDVVDGVLRVGGLTTGEETQILVMAFDADDLPTPVVDYIGTPTLAADAVVAKDAEGWAAVTYGIYGDEDCTTTEIESGYYHDVYVQVSKMENAEKVYIVKQYASSVEGLTAAETVGKLLAASNKAVVEADDWDENGKFVKNFMVDSSSRVFVFWADANGKYYEPVVAYDPTATAE